MTVEKEINILEIIDIVVEKNNMIKRERIKIIPIILILIIILIILRIMNIVDNCLPGEREVFQGRGIIEVDRTNEITVNQKEEKTANREEEMIIVQSTERIVVAQEKETIVTRRNEKIEGRREEIIEVVLRKEAVVDKGRDHLVIQENSLHLIEEEENRERI